MHPSRIYQSNNTIELSSDEDEPVNKMIELSSDEEEPENPKAKAMPTLFGLKNDILKTIAMKSALIPGECIQAIIEMIHRDTSRNELSCVNTDFFPHMLNGKNQEARQLLQPDDRCKGKPGFEWIASKNQQATAQSKVLLIPCHIVKLNKQKVITTSHWVLAARIKTQESRYKLVVFDSCGIKWARKQLRTIRKHLIKIKLLEENDAWEALNLKEQTEQECGIRMIVYMLWAQMTKEPHQIIQKIHKSNSDEKADTNDLASKYRSYVHQLVKREQHNLKK
jgi:hypothetical protein